MAKKLDLASYVRSIPDFPKPGILFRDITTLIKDKDAFKFAVNQIVDKYKDKKIDLVVGIEARGFIIGGAVALKLGTGFVPVRKKGKLPWRVRSITYDLEYGTDTLELHEDAVKEGTRVLIIDDLLATGGTVRATCDLLTNFKCKVAGIAFIIELVDLKGREKLKEHPVFSLIKFKGE
jgi:adenine phosphoribosyltransferase